MDFNYLFNEQPVTIQVEANASGFIVTLNGRAYAVTASTMPGRPGELALTINGARHLAWVAADGPRRWVAQEGEAMAVVLDVPQPSRRRRGAAGQAEALEAQMPGMVRRVLVAAGDAVERGQLLLLLEAMKMEIRVSAPHAGVVETVEVAEGQAVERGQVLLQVAKRA